MLFPMDFYFSICLIANYCFMLLDVQAAKINTSNVPVGFLMKLFKDKRQIVIYIYYLWRPIS